MSRPHDLRIAKPVAAALRELPPQVREELRTALLRAQSDPYVWPQADRYDLDDTVRVVTTARAVLHYAIVPATPHVWVFALTSL